MGLFDKLFGSKKQEPPPHSVSAPASQADRTLKVLELRITGVNYYTKNLKNLAESNPDWRRGAKKLVEDGKAGKRIFQHNYIHKPAKLIPEPTNPHDKNAVQAVVAGELVGYVSRDDNQRVLEILKRREIKYISAFISGGPYKIVSADGTVEKAEKTIYIDYKIGYV